MVAPKKGTYPRESPGRSRTHLRCLERALDRGTRPCSDSPHASSRSRSLMTVAAYHLPPVALGYLVSA
jgi:hypothetical protein